MTQPQNIDFEERLKAITPQFRPAYEAEYSHLSDVKRLDTNVGLMIPTDGQLDTLQVLLRNPKKTQLSYEIYLPRKKENYGPDEMISEGSVVIEANDDFVWVDIPVNLTVDGRYVLVMLKRNEWVNLAVGGDVLPTTNMLVATRNTQPNIVHISDMKIMDYSWARSSMSVCFKTVPDQKVYEPSNVINGYNRAYGMPNMWVSEAGENHELCLEWQEKKALSRLQITFGIDTTKRFYSECIDQIFDNIATDYEVYAIVDGQEQLVSNVTRNHKKVNTLAFDSVKTDKIIFRFNKTSMGRVGVYEVRAYE